MKKPKLIGGELSSAVPDRATEGWVRHRQNLELSGVDLLVRMIPIMVISLLLFIALKYDLLFISGLLFCFLVYDMSIQQKGDAFRSSNRRIFQIALFATLLSKILFFLKDIFIRHDTLQHTVLNPVELYKMCFLSASYQSFGFIKRGLIPTVVSFLSGSYLVQIYLVQLIGFLVFIAGLFFLNQKKNFSLAQKRIFIPVLLLSPIGIYYHFNFTLGFYDMALLGLLFMSIAYNNRPASILFDILGLMIHEAYIFLSLPFHIFNMISLIQKKKSYTVELTAIIVNILVLLIIVLWPRPGMEELKNNYFNHYSSLKSLTSVRDLDAFLPLSREGTLRYDFREMIRFYHSDKSMSFFFPILLSLINIGCLSYFTNNISGKSRIVDLLCSVIAFVFPLGLCLIGADFGRWLNFAYIGWIAYYVLFRPNLFSKAEISVTCLYGVLVTALIFLPFGFNYNPLFYFLFNK